MNSRTLLCDVGGTYLRFALGEKGAAMQSPSKLRADAHLSLEDAVRKFLWAQSVREEDISCFALAFSNRNSWDVTKDGIRQVLPNAVFLQINDFEANAYGVLTADPSSFDCITKGAGESVPGASRCVIGSGTGLGLAYIHGAKIQRTHGGHMLPALWREDHRELFVDLQATKTDGTIPIFENGLSGPGLFSIYRILSERAQLVPEYRDTNDLILRGGNDPVALEALRFFHEFLGLFAHEAVAFGYAYGGLYLTGGIIDRLMAAGLFDAETFLKNFHQNSVKVVREYVLATPIYWIRDEFVSLSGLLACANEKGF
jgi:glucokinase